MLTATYMSAMNMHNFLVLNDTAQAIHLAFDRNGPGTIQRQQLLWTVTLEQVFICTSSPLKIIIPLTHHFSLSLVNNSYDTPAHPNYNPVMSLTQTQHLDRLRVKNSFLMTTLWILNLNMSKSVTRWMNCYNTYTKNLSLHSPRDKM
jgi:hypothetical protein